MIVVCTRYFELPLSSDVFCVSLIPEVRLCDELRARFRGSVGVGRFQDVILKHGFLVVLPFSVDFVSRNMQEALDAHLSQTIGREGGDGLMLQHFTSTVHTLTIKDHDCCLTVLFLFN